MSLTDCTDTFRQEAHELLEQLEQALLDLEQTPSASELINTAFRALHTIKGSGAMFGFENVADFTHGFETAFDQVRKGLAPASRELVGVALAAKDHIRMLIERPEQADPAIGEAILGDLRNVVEGTPAAAGGGNAVADKAGDAGEPAQWDVRFRLPADALVNGTNPLLLLDELRALGEATAVASTDAVPPLDAIQPDGCYLGWSVLLTSEQPREAIEDVFVFSGDDAALTIEPHVGRDAAEAAADPTPPPRPCVRRAEATAPCTLHLAVFG
ncbi:MAG TPA: Hpt domain-containing protein [Rhodospirillales bacterium]|nr:Hpt domain-containing protein [Rhodospirillales bacterium]